MYVYMWCGIGMNDVCMWCGIGMNDVCMWCGIGMNVCIYVVWYWNE